MNYDDILGNIPDYIPKEERKVTLEDIEKIHPSLNAENPESWVIFKSVRPDLSKEDIEKIDLIIGKLHDLRNGELREQLLVWRKESETVVKPVEPVVTLVE